MANPIIRGFSKLTQFSGRDSRGEFWPYAGAVIALLFVLNFVLMGTVMAVAVANVMTYSADHSEATTPPDAPAQIPVEIDSSAAGAPIPDFTGIFVGFPILVLIVVLLLAAAVTRRLHDRNTAGFWGLMPLPFLTVGLTVMPILMSRMMIEPEPSFDLFGLLFLNNMLYLAALVTLIVLLARRGTPGPNRYGPAPVVPTMNPRDDWSTPG